MGEGGLHLVEGGGVGWKQPGWGGGLLRAKRPPSRARAAEQAPRALRWCHSPGCWVVATVGVRMGRGWAAPLEGTGRRLSRCRAL